ncbi:MAG: phosphate acyltransferase PlsX [Alphaproteobacteria bacterium]|nr:phosphate acyltransferase PlsX [Alphaproteobacteria bacterium]MCL2889690.1 phosphate acyltransferase PlsX [Alphaproteobacteria bacterium]
MSNQSKKIIAVDAHGGDKGPKAVLGGLNQFLFKHPGDDILFRIFGDEALLRKMLKKYQRVARNCEIINAPDVVSQTDKVRDIIRTAQTTSMYMAIKDVRDGNSCAIVSAGNTGALMALSKLAIKTIDGISRPAITTMLPAGGGDKRVVLLDLGANVQCDEENLFDFALMGSVYAEKIGKIVRPRVGILNIGEEEQKGQEYLQRLNNLFNEHKEYLPFEYVGFVEGTDISGGEVQVVVTDGFTGNIVLKTVEGTAKLMKRVMTDTFKKSIIAISVAFLLTHVFKRLKAKLDPRSYAGAIFIGLNGFVIKTHGSSDALTFANAVRYAADLADADFNSRIRASVRYMSKLKTELKNAT